MWRNTLSPDGDYLIHQFLISTIGICLTTIRIVFTEGDVCRFSIAIFPSLTIAHRHVLRGSRRGAWDKVIIAR
jgi:hypothetical protein